MIIDRPKAMSAPPRNGMPRRKPPSSPALERATPRPSGSYTAVTHPGIYGYLASRLGDPVASEDLTSEVFERALEGLPRYEQRGLSIACWLYRIAHDRLADHLRRQAQRPTLPLDERLLGGQGPLVQEGFAAQVDARLAGEQLARPYSARPSPSSRRSNSRSSRYASTPTSSWPRSPT